MVAPNNPQVVRVTMVFIRDTRTFVNTLHFQRALAWTLADMTTLANNVKTWWTVNYSFSCSTLVALSMVQVRLYNPANPLAVDLPVSPPVAGSNSGAAEAANVTLALSFRSGLAGRRYRGRIYVPGFSEAQTTDIDTITSATAAGLATQLGFVPAIGSALGAVHGIFHRDTNGFTAVTQYLVDVILDSQRRRLPGRGR